VNISQLKLRSEKFDNKETKCAVLNQVAVILKDVDWWVDKTFESNYVK
jgi:hypothetical protein